VLNVIKNALSIPVTLVKDAGRGICEIDFVPGRHKNSINGAYLSRNDRTFQCNNSKIFNKKHFLPEEIRPLPKVTQSLTSRGKKYFFNFD
jgi:hypothetical protein